MFISLSVSLLFFFFLFFKATVISVLEKLLSQSTEQDNPGRLVIEAAHGSAAKVRELVQKHPDKVRVPGGCVVEYSGVVLKESYLFRKK